MQEIFKKILTELNAGTGEVGQEFTSGKFTGMGWFFKEGHESSYPSLAMKQYPKTVNIYCHYNDDTGRYAKIFGKSNMGKGCIRISKLTPDRLAAIREIAETSK